MRCWRQSVSTALPVHLPPAADGVYLQTASTPSAGRPLRTDCVTKHQKGNASQASGLYLKGFHNEAPHLGSYVLRLSEIRNPSNHPKPGVYNLTSKTEQYRPDSLLNTDYEILAKVMARRLEEAVPSIISPDRVKWD